MMLGNNVENDQRELPSREMTMEALDGSILKWEKIVDGTGIDDGRDNCPLCQLFWEDDCNGCPVEENTGMTNCIGTPYDNWKNEEGGKPYMAVTEKEFIVARSMAEFLIELRRKIQDGTVNDDATDH